MDTRFSDLLTSKIQESGENVAARIINAIAGGGNEST